MKLRYYLRGLGIGILVTALILGIAGGKDNNMSDAQIRARAAELGMVDGSSTVLGNLQKGSSSENDGMQGEDTQPEETSESVEPQAMAGTQPVAEPESGSSPSQPPETDGQTATPDEVNDTQTVSITIQSGAGSYSVSQSLQQAGLVEDASAFDNYLNENGYSRRLRAGTFFIPVDAGTEEIARIITGG
ncbi:MAG: hypothetical protein J1E64_06205 [Acetatifactor sp.]|nr:hypothetical protein [Acetatifactor sp.]